MAKSTKTVGDLVAKNKTKSPTSLDDPLNSLKRESISRMKAALLAVNLDDPLDTANAIRQVTMMRVYHQVTRIVQYLDIMDKLEEKMYESIEYDLQASSTSDTSTMMKLIAIQEKLQKTIVDSNKLLAPYLDMEQYPAFNMVEAATIAPVEVLDLPPAKRNLLRENAGSILSDLTKLEKSSAEK